MQRYICDRSSFRMPTQRQYTDEGFLRVPGNVARTGIQEYLAKELGLDGNPNRIVRVYRPPEEVFNAESLSSYDGVDVTIEHPGGLVNSDNFRKVTAGVVRGVGVQDGEFVKLPELIIKDKAAIDAINSGKCELSAGYTAIYDECPGVTPDGEAYDYVQRNIRINHVALVDRARAGYQARIFDHNPLGGNTMPVLITTDSGRSVDVADPANAQLVADAFDRLQARVTTAEADAQAAKAVADARSEELTEAKKLTTDAAIAARVQAITNRQIAARKIAGDAFTCDSVDPIEIMRSALVIARPKIDWADKSAAYVTAAFDMEVEKEDEDEEDDKKAKPTGDAATLIAQLTQLARDGAKTTKDTAPVLTPYEKHKQALANAHKGA